MRRNQILFEGTLLKHLRPFYTLLQLKKPEKRASQFLCEKKTMKKVGLHSFISLLPFILLFITSCNGQSNSNVSQPESVATPKTGAQIDEYVVEIFEDSQGNLWFGTISEGVARYDGKSLTYFSTKDGLSGNTVASIAEDKAGNLWFGTHSGLSKYDGKTFTNFTVKEGLCDDRVSNILIDKAGNIWVGTWGGVCRYDGLFFTDFPVPIPDVELLPYQTTMNWVTEVMEDKHGNIWFGRDGYGACRYDGKAFTHFTKKDGLPSNNVQVIRADKQGNIWFGCRVTENDHPDPDKRKGDGGLSRYDGKTMIQYPGIEGLSKNETYAIAEDKAGNIWIGANGVGVYRYDPSAEQVGGESFKIYKGTDRMDLTSRFGVQDILEDRNGTLWFGFSGGLFRLSGSSIVNVTQNGLWK